MAAINQNDSFYAGNKRTLIFVVMNRDVDPVVPVNLTGMKIRWSISRENEDGTYSSVPLLEKTLDGGGITVVDAAAGKFQVPLVETDTVKLSGKYHQEAELLDGSNQNPVTVATGTLTLLKNIKNS